MMSSVWSVEEARPDRGKDAISLRVWIFWWLLAELDWCILVGPMVDGPFT